MSPTSDAQNQRSYGCSFGCGNPYDYIVISVRDGSTEFLCLPCYVRLATDMVAAVIDRQNPQVAAALNTINADSVTTVDGPSGKRGKHNAPVINEDPDLLDAFDAVITTDDLPDEFK